MNSYVIPIPGAMESLGKMYEYGKGVHPKLTTALEWYNKAVAEVQKQEKGVSFETTTGGSVFTVTFSDSFKMQLNENIERTLKKLGQIPASANTVTHKRKKS